MRERRSAMEVLDTIPFDLDSDALLGSLRIEPGSERAAAIAEAVEAVRPIIRPKAAYDACYIDERGDESVTLGGVTFTSRVLRVNLDGAERAFPFVATCGREAHDHTATCGDLIVKFALDTVMEQALHAACRHVVQAIRETYSLGGTSTMSPGSLADWPMEQQRQLFALLGDVRGRIGVELTESCLMIPIKSISGLLFPTEIRFESCQLCPREGCPGRRAEHDPVLWERRYGKPPPADIASPEGSVDP